MSRAAAPVLEVQGLTKRFGGLLAVDGVSFSVQEGEAVGIIGPNGAGKTTLFHLITGFLAPTAGRVLLRGEEITGLPPYAIARRGLARTFQLVRPFPGLTVLENLMVGAFSDRVWDWGAELAAARQRALEVAREVGLEAWLDREASLLPHGSLKRLEVGRAIMRWPSVLLLDEPFGGLGGQELERTAELVERLRASGMTVVLIEHKLRVLMRLVDRVIVLNFGRQLAEGTPQGVARDPAVQEAYLGRRGVA